MARAKLSDQERNAKEALGQAAKHAENARQQVMRFRDFVDHDARAELALIDLTVINLRQLHSFCLDASREIQPETVPMLRRFAPAAAFLLGSVVGGSASGVTSAMTQRAVEERQAISPAAEALEASIGVALEAVLPLDPIGPLPDDGVALKLWRKSLKLSQKEVGAEMDVHPSTISMWERGAVRTDHVDFSPLARLERQRRQNARASSWVTIIE